MPVPDLRLIDIPVGPYRDKIAVTIGSDDYERMQGFTCQVSSAGNLVYRTLGGATDVTESGLSAGDTITGPGGVPVLLRAVRATSTVTGIVVGIV